jgi:hypothetical protein
MSEDGSFIYCYGKQRLEGRVSVEWQDQWLLFGDCYEPVAGMVNPKTKDVRLFVRLPGAKPDVLTTNSKTCCK